MTAEAEPIVMTLEQFAREERLITTDDVQGHIHAGLRCKPTSKTFDRFYTRRLRELQDARDATTRAYRAEIAAGRIREPTRLERLEARANGHPDNPSVIAARNVLAKRAARMAAAKEGKE